jgi:hypothetical protein
MGFQYFITEIKSNEKQYHFSTIACYCATHIIYNNIIFHIVWSLQNTFRLREYIIMSYIYFIRSEV